MVANGKADIHNHTTASDGLQTPHEVVHYAATHTDLNVIAITDHDTVDGAHAAYDYWQRHRDQYPHLEVIKGIEVSSAGGHILGLFVEEDIPANMRVEDTISAIHEQGGLAIAAHPFTIMEFFFKPQGVGKGIAYLSELDGIEARNASPSELFANYQTMFFNRRHLSIPELGGSDAHFRTMIGKTHTLFPGTSAAELRRAIEAGEVRPAGHVVSPFSVIPAILYLMRYHVPQRLFGNQAPGHHGKTFGVQGGK